MSRFSFRPDWPLAVAGALLPLAFAPFGLAPLAVLCLAVLFLAWDDARNPRHAAWRGFLFGAGSFLTGTYWLYLSLHVFGKAPLPVAIFLMIALVCIMALYPAALGYAAARFLPAPGAWRWLAALPAGWLLSEWLRGWLASGFPWLALGYSQSDTPIGGYAPLLGVFGMGGIVALSAGALLTLLRGSARARAAAVAVLALTWGGGLWLERIEWTTPTGDRLAVAIVQGSIPQDRKWLPEQLEPTKEIYAGQSARHTDADLIVWPEAAIPQLLHEQEDFLSGVYRDLRASDTDLLLGVTEYDFEEQQFYNSVFGLGEKISRYRKRHLVPFGEYFPVPDFVRKWMRLMSLPYTDYTPGLRDQPALEIGGQRVGVSICYEDLFGEELIGVLAEATMLVNVSNDAWFGGSIAPHQHLQIARLRAMEARRPMVRATNTGISAFVERDGRIVSVAPQFEQTVLEGDVMPRSGRTPYARTGNLPVVVLALLVLLAARLAAPARTT